MNFDFFLKHVTALTQCLKQLYSDSNVSRKQGEFFSNGINTGTDLQSRGKSLRKWVGLDLDLDLDQYVAKHQFTEQSRTVLW